MPSRWLRWIVERCESPALSALLALAVYGAIAARSSHGFKPSSFAYFTYLADALLHGQLALRLWPPNTHDLSLFHDRLYLYWPPFPAIVELPFVALWGVRFSDVLFTVCAGALNVFLVAALLRAAVGRGFVRLSRLQRGWLVLFFAFGTVHFTLAPFGRVWFTAQVIGFGCVALAYLAALRLRGWRAFALAGLAISAAAATRNHLLFAGLWPAAYLLWTHRRESPARRVGLALIGIAPVLLGLGLLGVYNAQRFGSALDNGLRYHQMGLEFVADYARYGAFHPHYVPTNLYYQYLFYPLPYRDGSYMGGGLFWMSPVFLGALAAVVRARPRWSVGLLALSSVLVAIPILLLMGTGYVQLGPRYTLDFTVPLLMLTALGVRRWPRWTLGGLAALSMAQYLYCALHFMRYI